jgi:predicted DNA-binding transcriptional regulator AlpA
MEKADHSYATNSTLAQVEYLDNSAVCELIGGSRPIHPSTLWRGVKSGIYPEPVAVTPNNKRWKKSEVLAALEVRAAQRGKAVA